MAVVPGLITLLDGSDVQSLRSVRFHRIESSNSADARSTSVEERRLYLTRYMHEANKNKANRHTQPKPRGPVNQPTATSVADPSSASDVASISSPASASAYPPYSTHAVAEALLAESSILPAVRLSSLPAPIMSHCSPTLSSLPSLVASSSAVPRLQSMCSEPSTALLTRAFTDLHSRGFVVTAGQLYGGDLLLYEDDPSSCHAHSIVSVRSTDHSASDEPAISALDLLTVARIASGVNKGVIVAYEAAETGRDVVSKPALAIVPVCCAIECVECCYVVEVMPLLAAVCCCSSLVASGMAGGSYWRLSCRYFFTCITAIASRHYNTHNTTSRTASKSATRVTHCHIPPTRWRDCMSLRAWWCVH